MKDKKSSILKIFKKKIILYFAKVIIKKHNPEIVGIAGSTDKSLVSSVASHVFENSFNTRCVQSKQNDVELNFAFSVLGEIFEQRFENCIFSLVLYFLKEFFSKKYPRILILQYKTQKLGDMDLLLNIAKPNVVLFTNTTDKPCSFFGDKNDFLVEELKIITSVNPNKPKENQIVILNEDDSFVQKIKKQVNCSIYTYSTKKKSSFYATGIHLSVHEDVLHGISFKVNYDGNSVPIRLMNVIATNNIYSILGAITLASVYKINMIDIAQRLKNYMPPVSRMRYLDGINYSKIIDDTYDSSLESTYKALESLASIKSNRKIVVLGELPQICNLSKQDYKDIVKKIVSKNTNFIVLIGKKFDVTLDYLLKNSFVLDDNLFFCDSVMKAGEILEKRIKRGDLILIKGASEMRMEKIVKKLLKINK